MKKILGVLLFLALSSAAQAQTSIPVVDAGFETNAPVDTYNSGPVPGWGCVGGSPWDFGQWQPLSRGYFTSVPDGLTVLYLGRATCQQDLGIAAQPNTGYSFSVQIGHRSDGYDSQYAIKLQAAGVDLCPPLLGSNATIPLGTFAPVTISCTSGASVPAGNVTAVLTNTSGETAFDSVVVTTSGAVPPPTQTTLPQTLILGGAGAGKGIVITVTLETIPSCFLATDGDCSLALQVSMPSSSCTTALSTTTCTSSAGTIAIVKTFTLPTPQKATVPLASVASQP